MDAPVDRITFDKLPRAASSCGWGNVVTMAGTVTHAAFLIGTPVALVVNAATGQIDLAFGPNPSGPLEGQTLTFSGTGQANVAGLGSTAETTRPRNLPTPTDPGSERHTEAFLPSHIAGRSIAHWHTPRAPADGAHTSGRRRVRARRRHPITRHTAVTHGPRDKQTPPSVTRHPGRVDNIEYRFPG